MSRLGHLKNEEDEEAVSPVIATILMVAITVVLSGVLYTWASELASTQPSAVPLNNYAVENIYEPSESGTEDRLLRLSFPSGPEDLKWSFLTIALFEEIDSKSYKCSPTSDKCLITEETPDSVWASNEIITISENGEDICIFGNDCNLVVSIQYQGKSIAGDTSIKDLSTKKAAENCENNPLCTISFNDGSTTDSTLNENFGHYGPGGDDSQVWEQSLQWTCDGCNGKDLADAETINGENIISGKGIVYLLDSKQTIVNVGLPTWRTYSLSEDNSYGQFVSEATTPTLCEDTSIQADGIWDGVFEDADYHGIIPGCYIVGAGDVYEWQNSQYGQFVSSATSVELCEQASIEAGGIWDGAFNDANSHGISTGCYIVGAGNVYEWQSRTESTNLGHYGVGGDDSVLWEEELEWTCNSCNGKDLSDASNINGVNVNLEKGIIYITELQQTIFNSNEPTWRAFSSDDDSQSGVVNYGHYGPGGDDSEIWEPNLFWSCENCNGKDLADATSINGVSVELSKGILYFTVEKITLRDIEELVETTNYGHNGPGGDENELWENNLVWTCMGCNGKDLADASSIDGVAVDTSKGVLYDLEGEITSFNVDEPATSDSNLIWRGFGGYHETLVWSAYTSTESSSEMAEEFFRLLMETFITGDGDTFYSYFEGDDVVLWGGLTGCLEYEDTNGNGLYDNGEICNFDTSIESIRTNEESLCPDSTDEFCHPIGSDYSDYTMDNLISDYNFVIKDNSQILDGDCGFFMDDGMSDEGIRDACIEFVVENSNWESHFGDNDYLAFTSWKYDYNQNQYSNWFWDDPTVMVISFDEGEWKISWWLGLD